MPRKPKPDLDAIDAAMARKTIDDGGYAFPVPMVFDGSVVDTVNERGMSLRDWFAGKALARAQSLGPSAPAVGDVARWAYEQADAMLAERKR